MELDDVTEGRTIDRPKKKKLWIKHMATQYLGTREKKRRQQKRIMRRIKIKSVWYIRAKWRKDFNRGQSTVYFVKCKRNSQQNEDQEQTTGFSKTVFIYLKSYTAELIPIYFFLFIAIALMANFLQRYHIIIFSLLTHFLSHSKVSGGLRVMLIRNWHPFLLGK